MRIMTNVQPVTEIWKTNLNKRRYQHHKRYQNEKGIDEITINIVSINKRIEEIEKIQQGRHSQQTSKPQKQNEISRV